MLDKKKLHFWRLVLIFGAITVLALAVSFGYGYREKASMMNTSMGNMMGSMHLRNITIDDLIKQQESMEMVQGKNQSPDAWRAVPRSGTSSQNHNSHHGESSSFLKTAHYLTTAAIIILLPFIIAGTVFLTIIWLK